MKINRLLLFLPLMSLVFCFNSPEDDDEKMKTIMQSVQKTLQYLHYNPKTINDAYSEKVYEKYFEMIDPGKRFFMKSDIEEFEKYKKQLDDFFISGDLSFYKLTTDRLNQRVDSAEKAVEQILKNPISFTQEEDFILDSKKKDYPKNEQEFQNEWKKFIKYNILQEVETITAREESQKKKKDSVIARKLKDTIKLEKLTQEQKISKATGEIKDYVKQYFKRFKKRKKINWFSVYINAHTEVFDPHTNYFSPVNKEDFDASFKGEIIGIGALIQEKKGYLYFGELTIGAPAWKSKQIEAGDKIIKVKSKPNEELVNVSGMLVEEVVRLIRGELNSKVTIIIEKKKDKSIKEVTLTREKVSLEDTFARSLIINTPSGKKIGIINLPSFNANFDDKKGRNASDDVKNEILKLKKQNINGIILDLRNNGGGSLTEVGDIMGLFMNEGPYVQIKDREQNITTLRNKANTPIWDGPLLIMQNEFSASASEILAGQIQDYGRGIVLGSPQSFGKGTVQTFVDLNRFLSSNDDFGSLKLTIQKFYRVTGESTQRKGIEADIKMKDFYSYAEIGERFSDNALPWDKISPLGFNKMKNSNFASIISKSQERIDKNQNYQLLLESAVWKEKLDKEVSVPLNAQKFENLMKDRKNQIEKFKKLDNYKNGLKFTIHPEEKLREKTDVVFKKKTENWLKNLGRDLYVQEAVNIISEMK